MDEMTIEEYFAKHPEEEDEFYDEMYRLSNAGQIIEYPEDWPMYEVNYANS